MSRRLPNCATCGSPLAKAKARCVMVMNGVRGRPSVGYCWNKDKTDPNACGNGCPSIFGVRPGFQVKTSAGLRMIAERGPGRVTLLGKTTLDQACADADRLEAQSHG